MKIEPRNTGGVHRVGDGRLADATRRLLVDLDRKDVRASPVYGSNDVGLDERECHFGRNGSAFRKPSNVTVKALENVDHSLFSRGARETVLALFEDQCSGRRSAESSPVSLTYPVRIQARCVRRRG